MAFIPLTQGEVAPDQPVSTTLLDKVRTNFDDHEARLLAAASGGAIGEILNGSFEAADASVPTWPKDWTCSNGSGGLVQLSFDSIHGARSVEIQHNVGGGGGAYVETGYIAVSSVYIPDLPLSYKCSVTGLYFSVRARYFLADGNGLPSTLVGSEQILYESQTGNSLIWQPVLISPVPLMYANARFVRYKLLVGSGSTLGNAKFDGVGVPAVPGRQTFSPRIFSFGQKVWSVPQGAWRTVETASVTIPAGLRYLVLSGYKLSGYYYDAYLRFRLSGQAPVSTQIYSGINPTPPGAVMVQGSMTLDLSGIAPGTYTIILESIANDGGTGAYAAHGDASAGYEYCGHGILMVNGLTRVGTMVLPT